MNKFKSLNVSRGLLILACAAVGGVFAGCASGNTGTEATVTVVAPNGGEQVQRGGVFQIQWNTSGLSGSVEIELWKGGLALTTLAVGVSDVGSWAWSVPGAQELGDDYSIRVRSSTNPGLYDDSDGTFSIIEGSGFPLTVVTPNGGEVWGTGSTQTITWNTEGTILLVHVELWQSGAKVADIATDLTNSGQFSWDVPVNQSEGDTYRVRVIDAADLSVFDESDADFTISSSVQPSITVVTPNGGEVWEAGSSQDVTWSSTGNISSVNVELWLSGSKVADLGVGVANSGTLQWDIPGNQALDTAYRIRVMDSADASVFDESDGDFTIAEPASITVVTPNGGEAVQVDSNYNITWVTTGTVAGVDIELWKGGALHTTLSTGEPDNGQFTWAVPQGFDVGNDFRVRLTASNNAAVTDESDADFTIRDSLPVDCLDVLNTGGSTGDGTYMIDPDGAGGNPEIEVYCDMTAGGVTYEQLGFGQYNVSHAGWTLLSFAELSTVPVQQALIWAYNRQGGMVNLNSGWSSSNCCFAVSDSAIWLDFGSGLDYRVYPADQNGTANCNGPYNDAFMRFHRSAFPAEMTLASNYFVTYPPSLRTGCSDGNNPGFFFVRY